MDLVRRIVRQHAPQGRLLDVGCAQGTLGLSLAEDGFRVTLVDVRERCIEYARERYERGDVDFHCGLLSPSLPPSNDYDMVICTEVLEHVPAPSWLLSALCSKARPGGHILLTTPNSDYAFSRLPSYGRAAQQVIDGTEANSTDGDAHRFFYSREELISLVRGAGMRIKEHGFFSPFWLEGHLKTRVLHRVADKAGLHAALLAAVKGLAVNPIGSRRSCSAQWILATRDGT